jgi:hypothetical protein
MVQQWHQERAGTTITLLSTNVGRMRQPVLEAWAARPTHCRRTHFFIGSAARTALEVTVRCLSLFVDVNPCPAMKKMVGAGLMPA